MYEVVCDYGEGGRVVVLYTRDQEWARRIARNYEANDARVIRCEVLKETLEVNDEELPKS